MIPSNTYINSGKTRVIGMYCDNKFSGVLADIRHLGGSRSNTVEFTVQLDTPIVVYGQQRSLISIMSNGTNQIEIDFSEQLQ